MSAEIDSTFSRLRSTDRYQIRRLSMSLVASFLAISLPGLAFAQKTAAPVVEDRTITTEDKIDLKLTYYKGGRKKDTPVVLFLHGKGGSRQNWKEVALKFQKDMDFAVVAVDLRGHGDSQVKTKKLDYQAMVLQDLEAVKTFLFERHQDNELNMNKFGIVACDFGASVAMAFTELDWQKEPHEDGTVEEERTPRGHDVQALVLISPETSTPGLMVTQTAAGLKNLPKLNVLIAASEKAGHDSEAAKKIFDQVSVKREKSDRVVLKKYPDAVRGMNLVQQNRKLKVDMAEFLNKNVANFESKWVDRRSRIER